MSLSAYQNLHALYGDIHNHCAISYGHGQLADALANARERLDFVSITGHAWWPDMPAATPRLEPTIRFHLEGFARLRHGWNDMLAELRQANREGVFTIFPAFEIHSCASGDRNVLYRDLDRPDRDLRILYPQDIADLHRTLRALRLRGIDTLAQPHHIGYRKGTRGIDWSTFDPEFAPLVELLSMHGCSEESDSPRPFLHVMGPLDHEGTLQYGLARGHVFGITGSTDHHSAHPGSYGHGLTGAWVEEKHTRGNLWRAFYARRTWAMTGDRIALQFALNGQPMGSIVRHEPGRPRGLEARVEAGGAIDYVDIVKNNRLVRRLSECDVVPAGLSAGKNIRTKLFLELGWGGRGRSQVWEASLSVSDGRIVAVEPRFRGQQVVSPLEAEGADPSYYTARLLDRSAQGVAFTAVTAGNPNNVTAGTQGVCIEVEMPVEASVRCTLNGERLAWPLATLLEGARSGLMDGVESPAWRMHRAALPHQLNYTLEFEDSQDLSPMDTYYARVRQKNDQWAWSSPIFVREQA